MLQEVTRVRFFDLGDLFRRSDRNDMAAACAAFWPHVDQVIGHLDDVEVVFDDDDGVAFFDKTIERMNETGNVVRVEANGRFVENVDGASCSDFAQFAAELNALGFAAAERRGGLTEANVIEANVDHCL